MQAGVKKGDVVALYLTVSPIAVATMLATARIGTQLLTNDSASE